MKSRRFLFQAEDGIRYADVTGVQTCALPISDRESRDGAVGDRPRCHEGHRACRPRQPGDGGTGALALDLSRTGFAGPDDGVRQPARHVAHQMGHDGAHDPMADRPMSDERYPIGKFTPVAALSNAERQACIEQIAAAPANFRRAATGLTDAQVDTPYRSGGWTVRQVATPFPAST